MLIETKLERLLVVSDMHLGNPYSEARRALGAFFDYAREGAFDVCINGDGFEILQASFASLAHDSVGVLDRIRSHVDAGLKVYYVVGNHDIVLEQFLQSWSNVQITPFLNVASGDQRIRIEHGHLYDPSFLRHPAMYEFLTKLAGPFLRLYPDSYRLWSYWESFHQRLSHWRSDDWIERDVYSRAADMLLRRGFDVVIFGHTHRPLDISLGPGQRYVNSGNWVRGGSFVEVQAGRVVLKHWNDGNPKPVLPRDMTAL